MNWLVVNADDAGLDTATDDAILRCAEHGVVRSATVAVNGPTAGAFVTRALPSLDLGLHFNLTEGMAVAGPHRTLTDASGRFAHGKQELWRRACRNLLDPDEVRRELVAQWTRLIELGAEPSHVDGHNHVHLFPAARAALADLADAITTAATTSTPKTLWVRTSRPEAADGDPPAFLPAEFGSWACETGPWRATNRFAGFAFSEDPTRNAFLDPLDDPLDRTDHSPGVAAAVTEIMVHPGARPGSTFTESPDRAVETAILCAPELKLGIERRGLRLGGFREVSSCAS